MTSQSLTLLDRQLYGFAQVDRLLGLSPGTARRWIDGYRRGDRSYPPVVRSESTGDDVVTWGEFVEVRLLAEYRSADVPLIRMRPAIDRLREEFHPIYPLAFARPYVAERELVMRVQEEVKLEQRLRLVVIRNSQLLLTPPADHFYASADFGGDEREVVRLRPVADLPEIVIDPLRQFGEPVVRSVPTDVIAEQIRAGESFDAIADLYELTRAQVEAAARYELVRANGSSEAAA